MKIALILPTAFVTTLPDSENREKRISQYVRGIQQVAALVRLHPEFDVFSVDSTIADPAKIDQRLIDALNSISTLKERCFFNDNKLGKKNKGAGLIIQFKKILPLISREYEYLISFEPRQELENYDFFLRFLSRPDSYFRVEEVMVKKYHIFSFLLVQVMTGLFSIRRNDLERYVSQVNLTWMVIRRISIERHVYKFLYRFSIPFQKVERLNILWHDEANNVVIKF